MRLFLCAAIFLLAAGCGITPKKETNPSSGDEIRALRKELEDLKERTRKIEAQSPVPAKDVLLSAQERAVIVTVTRSYPGVEEDVCSATGVIVETNYVLTNYHLIQCYFRAKELLPKDASLMLKADGEPAQVLRSDVFPQIDLSLLSAKTPKMPRVVIDENVEYLQPVFYVGNTWKLGKIVSTGRVTFINSLFVYTDTVPGWSMSGSGLYNLEGRLIGLQTIMVGAPNVGYYSLTGAVPGRRIKNFLGW